MKIQWLGHACFVITSDDGLKILTDPYEPGGFGGALKYGKITTAPDIVTISHDHADHNYVKGVPGSPIVIRGAGDYVASGVEFHGVSTFHDMSQGGDRGDNVAFSFIVDDIKVVHMGDLGHPLSGDQAAAIGAVDVMLVPVGGFFTIGPEEAWQAADHLEAKIVIPMHFKTPKVDFPIAPVDDFLKDKQNIKRLGKSEVAIGKDMLTERRQIIVLDPAL